MRHHLHPAHEEKSEIWLKLTLPVPYSRLATKRLPRPRDPLALAKLIGDIATGQMVDAVDDGRHAAAAELRRKGGTAQSRCDALRLLERQRRDVHPHSRANR
jgi:hypothetical protein